MKSKFHLSFYLLLVMFLSCISIQQSQAQDTKVFELKNGSDNQTSMASKNSTNKDEVPYPLLYSLKPTIYIKNNDIVNITGPGSPVSINIADTNSINLLKTNNPLFNSVQIIKIQLNDPSDLNNSLDTSNIQGFDNLSYIYIMCHFKCTENQIRTFIKNSNTEIIIYFEQINPS